MKAAHPYEEVAYDVYPLKNTAAEFGIGRIGELAEPLSVEAFQAQIGEALHFTAIRAAGRRDRMVRTVAVCGGAGAELMPDAVLAGADILVTSDVRHHEFIEAEGRDFLLMDAGHAATESPGAEELARRLAASLPEIAVDFITAPLYSTS
jgi:putative NIF3 family GTP cyclohydrolase 1 type 2